MRRGADLHLSFTLELPDGAATPDMSINGVTLRGVGARSAYIFDPAPADMAEQSMLGTIVEDFGLSEM